MNTERKASFLRSLRTPGFTAIVFGNGASVDQADLWRPHVTAGTLAVLTNRALAMSAVQDLVWSPPCPVACVLRDGYRDLWHDSKWGIYYHEMLWKHWPGWRVGPANDRCTHCDEFVRIDGHEFQTEIRLDENHEAVVMRNSSVAIMAVNWAWLQGATKILLIGVDYAGRHAEMREPWQSAEPGWAGQYDQPVPDLIEEQFSKCVSAIHAQGGQLWQSNPDSRLRAVPILPSAPPRLRASNPAGRKKSRAEAQRRGEQP